MNELVYSGIGAQNSDQKIVSVSSTRPLWLLRPLPLSQVNPTAYGGWDAGRGCWRNTYVGVRGGPESLVSCCLGVISQNMHEYQPDTLDTLEPVLVEKIMTRVLNDRGVAWNTAKARQRPDDATMWAFIALNDPRGAARDIPSHTLELPTHSTLATLPPSRSRAGIEAVHPLIAAPYLFSKRGSDYAFLTTLQLDGLDDSVNDQSILALRYATHLTCLWTRGCRTLTDNGIRMLSSSLTPPNDVEEPQGMWRLRAWYLTGCVLVGDASMKSFAKWPGLVLLDVRNTSCTEAAVSIYNRANEALWGGAQHPFQTCTDGLAGLFANQPPDTILEKLAGTLIAPDIPEISVPDTEKKKGRTYLSLHLVSSYHTPPEEYLPDPRRDDPYDTQVNAFRSSGGVYRHGMGVVYGKNARAIVDEDRAKREKVKLAIELQSEDDIIAAAIASGETPPERRFDREKRERMEGLKEFYADLKRKRKERSLQKKWMNDKTGRIGYDDVYGAMDRHDHAVKGWKTRRANEAGEKIEVAASPIVFRDEAMEAEAHSRAFVKGRRIWGDEDDGVVRGDPAVMLVRMVCPEWETMRYHAHKAAPTQVKAKRRAGAAESIADMLLASQRDLPENDVMGSAAMIDTAPFPASQDMKPTDTQLAASLRLDHVPDSQPGCSQPTQASQLQPSPPPPRFSHFSEPSQSQRRSQQAPQPSFNPFRTGKMAKNPLGVTRLGDHICPEVKREPEPEPQAGRSKSGVLPLKGSSSFEKSGVTPLKSAPSKSGVTPLKGTSSGGIVPLKSSMKNSVAPLKSSPATQTKTKSTATAKSAATTKKTPTPKSTTQAKKETQTKLDFCAKRT